MAGFEPAASPTPRSLPRPAVPTTTADGAFGVSTMKDPIIALVNFTDGVRRAVYEEVDSRQYVIGNDCDPVHGVVHSNRRRRGLAGHRERG